MTLESLLQNLLTNDRRFVGELPIDCELEDAEAQLLRAYLGAGLTMTDYPALNRQIWTESTAGLEERLAGARTVEEGADILNYLVPWQIYREVIRPNRKALAERFDNVDGLLGLNDELGRRVVYRPTSEGYTLDPLATLDRGYGRCGELSVAFAGLCRAKGLSARQVYVPFWAHQDDNHAWVEVKTDAWHFIGAAEPELETDRGWFEAAATRAPFVLARAIFKVPGQPYPKLVSGGYAVFHNTPYFQSHTVNLTVTLDGQPLADQPVYLQILNEGRLRTLVALNAEPDGTLVLDLNAGDYRLSTVIEDELYEKDLTVSGDITLTWEIAENKVPDLCHRAGEQHAPVLQRQAKKTLWPEEERTAHKMSCNKSYEGRQARLRAEMDQAIEALVLPGISVEKTSLFKDGLRAMNGGARDWIQRVEGQSTAKVEDLIDTFLAFSDKERFYRRTFFAAPTQEERLPDHQGHLVLQRMDPERRELWHTVRQLPMEEESLAALKQELRWDPHRYRLQRTYRKQNGNVLYAEYCFLGHQLPEPAQVLEQLVFEVPSETADLLHQQASETLLSYVPEGTGILVFHGTGEVKVRLQKELEGLRDKGLPLPIVELDEVPPETIVREAYLEPDTPPYVFYLKDNELQKATCGFSIGTDQWLLALTRDLFDTFEG